MRLLFDGRVFQFQKAGGINRYFAEIISALPVEWEPVVTGVHDHSFGENRPSHPRLRVENPPEFRPRRFRQAVRERWWKPRLLDSLDLAHPTYYDFTSGLAIDDFKCPVVMTVYDMIYAKFPAQMEDAAAVLEHQRRAVDRADRIVCISKSTEQDLLELMPSARGKTKVIYLGSSFPPIATPAVQTGSRPPNFLFVGGRGGYKNFLFLLRTFAKAAQSRPEIRLTVAGPPLTGEERWQMHFLGISDRVTSVVYPSEEVLRSLYMNSTALLYPSRYEGFGIPPLEAMACGTLAVTGNTSSLPEVVGDAGIMIDPADEDGWTDCIKTLGRHYRDRELLVGRGLERARQFTWGECVRKHCEIYRSLI